MDSLRKHLQTLGLTDQATLAEAQAAYKDLIRVWHPDRFESDPKLRAKAEAQTREITLAMSEVRAALKNNRSRPQPPPSSAQQQQQDRRSSSTPTDPMRFATYQTSSQPRNAIPTLAIHQAKRVSLFQILSGLAMFYLGLLLVVNFSNKGPAQTALGVVLIGHGFSTSLLGLALFCLKRPVITVNRSFLNILGTPAISLLHVADSRMILSRKGSYLTVSCTPEYVKTLPLHLRWAMKVRHLVRRSHFEFKATSLDAHPAHVIDMLDMVASLQIPPMRVAQRRLWGSYANAFATMCIGLALARCLIQHDTSLTSLVPYLVLFVIFRSAALIQTVVLAPSR